MDGGRVNEDNYYYSSAKEGCVHRSCGCSACHELKPVKPVAYFLPDDNVMEFSRKKQAPTWNCLQKVLCIVVTWKIEDPISFILY